MKKLQQLPSPHTHWYLGVCDYPVYKLEIELDHSISLEECIAKHDMPCKSDVVYSKDQVNANRKSQARWIAHTTGNAYVLYVQNRTSDHSFRVIGHGKNVFQAVRRYYRGLSNDDNWIWKCTKVVAVYTMLDNGMSTSGDLLCGQPQESFPY